MTSVMRKILELRRAAQLRNQRPLTIEIGELQARRLADELNERGSVTLLVGGTEETRPLTGVSPGSPRLQPWEEWDRAAAHLVTDSHPRDAIVDASRSTVETEAEQSRSPAMGATDKPLGLSQELLTWHDIVHPDSRLYGMSFVGAEWSEYLSVRSEGQSVLPEEHRLKVSTTPDKPDQY